MTQHDQQASLMELMGWRDIKLHTPEIRHGDPVTQPYLCGIPPGRPDGYYARLPDLTLDLLHQAEMMLSDDQYLRFALGLGPLTSQRYRNYISATVPQRMEAILRAVRRWIE
jgi:hypothetical protein